MYIIIIIIVDEIVVSLCYLLLVGTLGETWATSRIEHSTASK